MGPSCGVRLDSDFKQKSALDKHTAVTGGRTTPCVVEDSTCNNKSRSTLTGAINTGQAQRPSAEALGQHPGKRRRPLQQEGRAISYRTNQHRTHRSSAEVLARHPCNREHSTCNKKARSHKTGDVSNRSCPRIRRVAQRTRG